MKPTFFHYAVIINHLNDLNLMIDFNTKYLTKSISIQELYDIYSNMLKKQEKDVSLKDTSFTDVSSTDTFSKIFLLRYTF